MHKAENGQIGLEKAQVLIPKIIIFEVMMPMMDGIGLSNQLQSKKETSHISIVLLTAKISKESESKGLKTGSDTYIRKPFDVEILQLKLNNIVNIVRN